MPLSPLGIAQVSQWVAYSPTVTLPNSPIAFVDATTGWMVRGLASAPTLDDDLSAGPTGSVWPGPSVAYTTDGGHSWQTQLTSPAGIWGVDAISPTTAWAVGVNALYETTNSGMTWDALLSNETGGSNLVEVAFSSAADGAGVTAAGALETTTDGGATWSPAQFAPTTPISAVCSESGTLIAAASDGQIWTRGPLAFGGSWSRTYSPPASITEPNSAAIVSCASGTAWEVVAQEQSPSGSTNPGLYVVEQSSTSRWTGKNASTFAAGAPNPGVAAPPASNLSLTWIPVSGSSTPYLVATANTSGEEGLFSASSSSRTFVMANGTGPLFAGAGAPTYRGVDFGPDGSGWLLVDLIPAPTHRYSASDIPSSTTEQLLLCHLDEGASRWTEVYSQQMTVQPRT